MKLFHSVGILGSLVLAGLAGCSSAARDASTNNESPVASKVLVTGNNPNQVGDVLTVSYTYTDPENDAEPAAGSQFRWLRGGAAITGATGRTYTLMLGDAGKTITAEVTPLAQTGARSGAPVVSNFVTVAPADPVALTVSAGLKQLRFNWAPVSGAATYRVSYNADGVSGFTVVSGNLSTTSYDWDIGVHRINWPQAQFLLEACDAGGCLPSASISAVSLMVNTIGYFKASNPGVGDFFGIAVALSGDGNTLAVGAYHENSSTTGINSIPNDLGSNVGAVYVYSRTSTTWSQQAYVKASNTGGSFFDRSVALSANGNTLAVGADGSETVYVYIRSGVTWSEQAYVKASNTEPDDGFGISVSLSANGDTLAVGAYFEDGVKAGVIAGAPAEAAAPNGVSNSGAVYVYTRTGITWTQHAYLKASNPGVSNQFGYAVALSADSNTLAVGAYAEDSAATGINGNQEGCPGTNCASYAGAVYVFTRSDSPPWSQQAYVKGSNTGTNDDFGMSVALSANGNTLAVGAIGEASAATGVNNTVPGQNDNSLLPSGAVYVFTRTTTTWNQEAYVKASNTGLGDTYGYSIALSSDGNTLAVGAYNESSGKTGVTPGAPSEVDTPNDVNYATSGAVYVYGRNTTLWSQQAYVKASNTGKGDYFGRSTALSADGNTLAVGAMSEGSAGTGVNNTLPGGAVYLY